MIRRHDAKKKADESKNSVESTEKEEERRRSPTPPPARKSPEPSCAICLEHLTNKSFTDSCFHMFCFTCLVEWSKVKPECPLCKKSFSSIVHNVRSFKDFDQYYVNKSRTTDETRVRGRFQYRTTLTPERLNLTRNSPELDSYLSHRMRFAPHSVHSYRISYSSSLMPSRRIPNAFRQRVYDEDLWVLPLNSNRVRVISPEFFRQNIACTHRLLPWLNRELLVVMPNNESQISFVIELIMALISKYDIKSQEFYSLIEPYTASHTAHFIHEFYNFAVSPYETLESYDLHAQYDIAPIETLSSDSDVIPLPMDYSNSVQQSTSTSTGSSSSRRKKQSHPRKKHSKGSKKLKKIILKRNNEKNVWESSFTPAPAVPFASSSYIPNSLSFETAGPSTSREIPFPTYTPESPPPEIDIFSDVEVVDIPVEPVAEPVVDDDECRVVDVLKPRHERTPEIFTLSSDDELIANITNNVKIDDNGTNDDITIDDNGTNDDVKIDDNGTNDDVTIEDNGTNDDVTIEDNGTNDDVTIEDNGTNDDVTIDDNVANDVTIDDSDANPRIVSVTTEDNTAENLTLIVSDDECEILFFQETNKNSEKTLTDTVNDDKPIDYSFKKEKEEKFDTKSNIPSVDPCTSSSNNINFESDVSNLHKYIGDSKLKTIKPERSSVIQSVVRTVTNDDAGSCSLSPLIRPKKRRSFVLDDDSTEISSDGAQVSEAETRKKKLKLKSVVAHYTFENSDEHESIRHSSQHKKHKERKKKKKKHKHRRRIFSSDSD